MNEGSSRFPVTLAPPNNAVWIIGKMSLFVQMMRDESRRRGQPRHITLEEYVEKFGVRQRDDSLARFGIYKGDTIIVARLETPQPGRVHAVFIEDRGLAVRRIDQCECGLFQIQASREDETPACYHEEAFHVMGLMIGLMPTGEPTPDPVKHHRTHQSTEGGLQ